MFCFWCWYYAVRVLKKSVLQQYTRKAFGKMRGYEFATPFANRLGFMVSQGLGCKHLLFRWLNRFGLVELVGYVL